MNTLSRRQFARFINSQCKVYVLSPSLIYSNNWFIRQEINNVNNKILVMDSGLKYFEQMTVPQRIQIMPSASYTEGCNGCLEDFWALIDGQLFSDDSYECEEL
eukprot:UN09377